ncbi:tetratricopeptide repeat protein [Thermodesulfobacteriota bacterium]
MLRRGLGIPQNHREAVKWYRRAADLGHIGAQLGLGHAYARGQGCAQDYKQAALWYRKAAEQGFAEAQASLGLLYQQGLGVTEDHGKAQNGSGLQRVRVARLRTVSCTRVSCH